MYTKFGEGGFEIVGQHIIGVRGECPIAKGIAQTASVTCAAAAKGREVRVGNTSVSQ